MDMFNNIILKRKQKQDNKIMEEIKHEGNPKTIYGLIKKLQLDDSRMQIFRLFDENHVFDSFKEKYGEISNILENPYNIFTLLQKDENKLEMIKYFYTYGTALDGIDLCIGETKNTCNQILLEAMETQEYKEEALEVMYDFIDLSYESTEEKVLGIIDNMQPERREKFLQDHNFNNRMTLKLYNKYNDERLIQKSDSSMGEYLSSSESYPVISGVNQQRAKKLLELYGDTMYPTNLGECVETSCDSVKDLENMLSKYYERLKGEINSIFTSKTLWSYDYQMIEMFIEKFSKDIDEWHLHLILENYNESLARAEEQIQKHKDKADKIKDFVEHDQENPRFLYDMTCKYYDAKMQDEKFESKSVNRVIARLPLMNRLEFVKRYQDTITISRLAGISEEVVEHSQNLDIKKFLIEYQDVISTQDMIGIINSVPFKQRIELIKVCNLDEEQKKEIIEYAQENGEQNVSFLELAATKAELEKMKENTQEHSQQDEIGVDTNLFPSNYEDGNR